MPISRVRFLELLIELGVCQIYGANTRGDDHPIHSEENPETGFFIDLGSVVSADRPGPLHPYHFGYAGELLLDAIKASNVTFNCIAGLPSAGDPFVDTLKPALGVRRTWLKKVSIQNTVRIEIPGGEDPGRILLVVDVIDRGFRTLNAIEELERRDFQVEGVVAFVKRQTGAAEKLKEKGIPLIHVFTAQEFLQRLVDIGRISSQTMEALLREQVKPRPTDCPISSS